MNDSAIYNEALSKGAGLLKELEENLSEKEVRKLELLGYIENAISSQGETWKLTRKGLKLRKLLCGGNTPLDALKDWIYKHFLKFNVNL